MNTIDQFLKRADVVSVPSGTRPDKTERFTDGPIVIREENPKPDYYLKWRDRLRPARPSGEGSHTPSQPSKQRSPGQPFTPSRMEGDSY